ncbi:DMT family transporter [Halogeometricum borinquense]|uniref:DMT family transporter n=1 Tax=Halogeometricum borinquense TaxID=60847 RepID=A0A6C0UF57_9EURY|nr:DMT family transporter [Halogeometricum borinquense]QIB72881.1 DMT family transporter [Halogeometricum borinquense]QIQ75160.1 DMT family transporter [Halogeometricum borinquense]
MRHRTTAAFVFLSAIWGTAFVATKVGLASLPPTLFAAMRFDIAAAVLFGFAYLRSDRLHPTSRAEWYPIITGGMLNIGVHHAFLFSGQAYIDNAAVPAVLLGLIPVITPVLTRLTASSERLSPVGLVGLVLGFTGVVIIADPKPAALLSSDLMGVGLVLASAVAFALGAVLTHGSKSELPFFSIQAWTMLIGAVFLHATSVALPWESFAGARWTLDGVISLVYLGVVAGAGGFGLYFWLLDHIGPIEASLLEYVIPVFAAIGGWIVRGNTIDTNTVIGFAVIFVGFLLVKRADVRRELVRLRERGRTAASDAD